MTRRAVFVDKDGTLLVNVPFNVNPLYMQLIEGTVEFLRSARNAGYRLFVISNQPGIARGYFPESAMITVWDHMQRLLRRQGVALDGFYFCPHSPLSGLLPHDRACDCRKPAPGLLIQAANDYNLDLKNSWMVGDILDDIEAGRRAGCQTILLDCGNETEWKISDMRRPTLQVHDLREAEHLFEAKAAVS